MPRLAAPTRNEAPLAAQAMLDAIEEQLGIVPNMHLVLSLSPAALNAYRSMNAVLGLTLDVATRERIALSVAQCNGCDYCLSAHAYLALNAAKLSENEIDLNRQGRSHDARADAAVRFARRVVEMRGQVADADIESVRAAGYSDGEIIEIIAVVAINIFTNYVNNVVRTDIDFPHVCAAAA